MTRFAIVASCLIGAMHASVSAQNPRPPQAPLSVPQAVRDRPRTTAGTATIRGRVYAAETRAPLRRARVNVTSDAPGAPVDLYPDGVTTGADGRYEITNLPPGRYRLFARRTGYVQVDFGARRAGSADRSVPTDSERGVTIELTGGQSFDAADFYLPRAGVITGRVLDENGDPLVGAFVGVLRANKVGGRLRTSVFGLDSTDDQGEYRLFGLPPGDYYVSAAPPPMLRAPGQMATYADVLYPGVAVREQATAIPVALGQEVSDVTFTMAPVRLARVSGTIATSHGNPAPGTALVLSRTNTGTGFEQGATVWSLNTTRDGAFAVSAVVPGDYDLSVQVQTDGGREVGSQHFSVWGTDVTGVTIVTAPEGKLVGTVRTDKGGPPPLGGKTALRVTAARLAGARDPIFGVPSPGAPAVGTVNADGSFSMTTLPGARLINMTGLPVGWALAAVRTADRDITDTPSEVQPGTQLDVQIMVTNQLGTISGSVVDRDGKPTWDYRVVTFPAESARWLPELGLVKIGRPNQLGRFELDRLRPGAYYVVAIGGSDVEWSDAAVLESLKALASEVTVGASETKTVALTAVRYEGRFDSLRSLTAGR